MRAPCLGPSPKRLMARRRKYMTAPVEPMVLPTERIVCRWSRVISSWFPPVSARIGRGITKKSGIGERFRVGDFGWRGGGVLSVEFAACGGSWQFPVREIRATSDEIRDTSCPIYASTLRRVPAAAAVCGAHPTVVGRFTLHASRIPRHAGRRLEAVGRRLEESRLTHAARRFTLHASRITRDAGCRL